MVHCLIVASTASEPTSNSRRFQLRHAIWSFMWLEIETDAVERRRRVQEDPSYPEPQNYKSLRQGGHLKDNGRCNKIDELGMETAILEKMQLQNALMAIHNNLQHLDPMQRGRYWQRVAWRDTWDIRICSSAYPQLDFNDYNICWFILSLHSPESTKVTAARWMNCGIWWNHSCVRHIIMPPVLPTFTIHCWGYDDCLLCAFQNWNSEYKATALGNDARTTI